MAPLNATLEYTKNAVMTASKAKLIVLMYEGAVRFVEQARFHLKRGNTAGCGTAISNAYNVVSELKVSLDREAGGQVGEKLSDDLERLYTFILEQLVNANMERNEESLEDALEILTILKEAWEEIVHQA